MHRFWKAVVRPVVDAIEPRVVVEIGTEKGEHTRLLLEHRPEAVVHVVDPQPRFDTDEWRRRYGERFVFHQEKSLNGLPRIGQVDLALIDGDHNWYTVYHELKLISKRAAAEGRAFPVVMLHDVDWPYGRRDLYYDPEAIPPAYRQPYRRLGMSPESPELVEHGGLNPHLENSIYEHDLRNGVRTAVQDFLEEVGPDVQEVDIPGLHGLGILVSQRAVTQNPALADVLASFRSSQFLSEHCAELEHARLRLQISASESAEELAAAADRERKLTADLSAYQQQLAAGGEELSRAAAREAAAEGKRKQLEAAVEQLRKEVEAEREAASTRQRQLAAREEELRRGDAERAVAATEECNRLASELNAVRAELEAVSEERAPLEDELLERQRSLEAAREEAARYLQALEAERAENGNAQQQVAARDEELRRHAAERVAAAEAQREQLESELQSVRGELEVTSAERGRLAAVLLEHQKAVNAKDATAQAGAAPDAPELAVREELRRRYAEAAPEESDWGVGEAMSFALPIDRAGALRPAAASGVEGVTADVVICVHNALEDVKRCLWSLLAKTRHPFHLVLVNDGSDQETSDYLIRIAGVHPQVTLIHNHEPPHGYTVAANLGLKASTGSYVVLLNSDTIVTYGWLDRLIACGESDERIGILGPLSNAASHQSVPLLREPGGWATNPLPDWLTPDAMGFVLARSSQNTAPRIPFINGFCYVVKRSVIDEIGYFDEECFAAGYCEENDFSQRARDAGFALAVADDAYVYHAKSKSYGFEGRAAVATEHYTKFLDKHGAEKISSLVKQLEADRSLMQLRKSVGATISDGSSFRERFGSICPSPLSVTFVLPGMPRGSGGGVHSIYQETLGMRSLGIDARVALGAGSWERAAEAYPDAEAVFFPVSGNDDLLEKTRGSDVIVATHFKSVAMVQSIAEWRDDFLPAYYIQDYEPFFGEHTSDTADEALLSYGAIPGQVLFAKTHWLCNLLGRIHDLPVAKVEPSIDHEVYNAGGRKPLQPGEPVTIVGMVRPRTPRRQPVATLRLLDRLQREFGDRVRVLTFGCSNADVRALERGEPYRVLHQGLLTRNQVGELLRAAEVFLDLSVYQAFGRTGLEAMACGCTSILPQVGGAHEFAVDGHNGLLVDTADEEGSYESLAALIQDADRLQELQAKALQTAQSYSVLGAALSEYVLFEHEYAERIGAGRAESRSPIVATAG